MKLEVLRLGRKAYEEVWELQRSLQQALQKGKGRDTLILCEHEPVITVGKSAHEENILLPPEELRRRGVDLFYVERGGDVTWHGPGQLVGYPILNLKDHKTDVHWYMRGLEQILIEALELFGIQGVRVEGKTGVWVHPGAKESPFKELKIASMGVRLSRWVTLHGFSLNVRDCSAGFSLINPCGFKSVEVTSMERELGREFQLPEVEEAVIDSFTRFFYPSSSERAVSKNG